MKTRTIVALAGAVNIRKGATIMRVLGFILASGAVCLLLAGSALATSTGWVTMRFTGVSPGDGVSTNMGGTTAGVYNHRIYLYPTRWGDLLDGPDPDTLPDQEASQLIGSLTYAGGGKDAKGAYTTGAYANVQTFCADFRQYVYTGEDVRRDIFRPADAPIGNGNTPMGDDKAADLRRLWDQYSGYGIGNAPLGTYTANEKSAAFQTCVWEIIYETAAYNVTANTFRVTSGETWTGLANTWLGNLETVDPDIGLRILVSETRQDFAIIVPGVGADPIPEPVTMAGLALGIGGLVSYARKRRMA